MSDNPYTNPYRKLLDAGAQIDHHESDLYVEATPATVEIVEASGWSFSRFVSQIDGKVWLDIPFGYEPFWDAKARAR